MHQGVYYKHMKRPGTLSVAYGSGLLILICVLSFVNWARFDTVEAQVFDITFADGEESQIIEYTHNDVGYEAEYVLSELDDGEKIRIHVDKNNPGDYLQAPSILQKNITIALAALGTLALLPLVSAKKR